ncbi:MAG: F0F1 ATP synthase subunit B [Sarcina sp.]
MQIQLSTVCMTIINFIILLIILYFAFWKKVRVAIEERQQSIINKIQSADEKFKEGEEFKRTNEEILNSAKDEGKKITEARKKQADKIYEEIMDSARKESSAMKDRAEGEIQRELEKAKFEIKEQVIELAVIVSEKAISKSLDEAEHRRLIDTFIDEVI